MDNKEKIIKKIKSLEIVKELNILDKEIERLFPSFNTYINLNEICNNSNEETCNLHHFTYIRNPKTNSILEVKCYCEKQKKENTINKRVLYCTNRQEILNIIKGKSKPIDIQYNVTNYSNSSNNLKTPTINSKGLYVYGDYSIEKTPFLNTLLKEFFNKNEGSICFINSNDLFEKLQNRQQNENDILELIHSDALFITDFGLEKWPKNYLFEEELISFLQERLSAKKSNFISSIIPINDLISLYKSRKVYPFKAKLIANIIQQLTNSIEIELLRLENK